MSRTARWIIVPIVFSLAACGSFSIQGERLSADQATRQTVAGTPMSDLEGSDPHSTQTADPGSATAPTGTATESTAAACPQATDGTVSYQNQEAGFCLLYPEELSIQTDGLPAREAVWLQGPPFPPDALEPFRVHVMVRYNGPALYVETPADYANMWVDVLWEPAGEEPQAVPLDINGHPAVLMLNLNTMAFSQMAFLIVDGRQYTISLAPEVGAVSQLDALAQEAWDTVISSIVFFEPAVRGDAIRPEDVCPQPAAGEQRALSYALGVCFLAPADATPHELFPDNGFQIGPEVDYPAWDMPVRVALVVGSAGSALGQTDLRTASPGLLSDDAAQSTIQDVTIGGQPAITWWDADDPWVHRNATVIANDTIYTVVMNPYDEQKFPDLIPDADRLWDKAVNSLAFFTPFK